MVGESQDSHFPSTDSTLKHRSLQNLNFQNAGFTQITDIRLPLEGTSSRWIFLQIKTVIHHEKHYMHLSKWRHKYHWGTGNYITQKTFLSLRLSGTLTLALPPKTCNEICNCIYHWGAHDHIGQNASHCILKIHQLEWLPVRSMQRWVRTWYSIVRSERTCIHMEEQQFCIDRYIEKNKVAHEPEEIVAQMLHKKFHVIC